MIRKLWHKLPWGFRELAPILGIQLLYVLIIWIPIMYVCVHFLRKYW